MTELYSNLPTIVKASTHQNRLRNCCKTNISTSNTTSEQSVHYIFLTK